MNPIKTQVEKHYHQEDLFGKIIEALKKNNLDPEKIVRSNIEGVDEFHVRGAAVSKKIATYADIKGLKVLDVGCGIGGPARMLRADYDCEVTGIDLSEAYIAAANKLTALVGIKDGIEFKVGDALNLPFKDDSFDVVWTQHVQMNIENKAKFYREISRVLKAGGKFIHYEILKKGNGKIDYPVPWANDAQISFLSTKENLAQIMEAVGLEPIKVEDETAKGIEFFENLMGKMQRNELQGVGLNLLMGDSIKIKIGHLLDGLKNGALELQSGLFVLRSTYSPSDKHL